MNKHVLYAGAIIMVSLGWVSYSLDFSGEGYIAVGVGLAWIGASVK